MDEIYFKLLKITTESQKNLITVIELQQFDEYDYDENAWVRDDKREGDELKFDNEEDAINWLFDNIKEKFIDPEYKDHRCLMKNGELCNNSEDIEDTSNYTEDQLGTQFSVHFRLMYCSSEDYVTIIRPKFHHDHQEYSLKDKKGNLLQFIFKSEAEKWLNNNVKPEKIDPDYNDFHFLMKNEELCDANSQKEIDRKIEFYKDSDEITQYRLMYDSSKEYVTIKKLFWWKADEFDETRWLKNNEGDELLFATKEKAKIWLNDNVKHKNIDPKYKRKMEESI